MCPWCALNPSDDVDPERLCLDHLAEYEGLSVAELERRDSEQTAEWLDSH